MPAEILLVAASNHEQFTGWATIDGECYEAEQIALQFLAVIWTTLKQQQLEPSRVIFSRH